MRTSRIALVVAWGLLLLPACDLLNKPGSDAGASSSSGSAGSQPKYAPPTLDDLSMPTSVQPGTDGFYTLIGSISFHDDANQPVHFFRVNVPVIGKTYDFPAGDVTSVIGAEIEIKLSADVPLGGAGPTNYRVSLVDSSGDESQPVVETVDLQ